MRDFERIEELIKDKNKLILSIYHEILRLDHHADHESNQMKLSLLMTSNSLQRILTEYLGVENQNTVDVKYCNRFNLPLVKNSESNENN